MGLGSLQADFGNGFPAMPLRSRMSTKNRRRIALMVETLEGRTLLSTTGRGIVAIEVPSNYISQQSSQLEVTLVRALVTDRSSLTVKFSATSGSPTGTAAEPDVTGQPFTSVRESVTFPAGQTTENVVVPINSQAENSGLVPIQLTAAIAGRTAKEKATTVYLASSLAAVPPTIIGVQRVAGGIAVTFSKPMNAATVEDIHNYAIRFSPNQNFNLEDLYGVGLIQTLSNSKTTIPIRRASYDPATNTVTLITNEPLGPNGSYQITNAPSLQSKKPRPYKAQPLTDLEGNALNEGGSFVGSFSITISKGKPYVAAPPVLYDGT
jgi:hypothetical protein